MENTDNERMLTVRKETEICAECSAEYILPDYKGDVKRVLHTEARVLPSGSFVDGGRAELGGVTVFDILYLDSENKLTSVEFTGDYSAVVPMKDGADEIFADFGAENVNIRLSGPRRMTAKCTVRAAVRNQFGMSCAAVGGTFDAECEPEICTHTVKSMRALKGSFGDREYTEEFFFAAGAALDDVDVIAKRADVRINTVTMSEDHAAVSGDICVCALVGIAEARPYVKEMKIPFEETVEVLGATEENEGTARARISSLECSMNPTDDGVRVNVSVISDIEVTAYGNTATHVVTDAYSTRAEVENRYERISYDELYGVRGMATRVSGEIPKSNTDAANACEIIYMSTEARITETSIASSGVNIKGEVQFSGVACEICDDGTTMYTPLKLLLPFDENVNFNSQIPGAASAECIAHSSEAKITLDENSFYAECALTLTADILVKKDATRLASSEITAEAVNPCRANVISVYYPDTGDTLFEIAKRFKTSVARIAESNSLTAEAVKAQDTPFSLAGVDRLIIKDM